MLSGFEAQWRPGRCAMVTAPSFPARPGRDFLNEVSDSPQCGSRATSVGRLTQIAHSPDASPERGSSW
eukprot:5315338-Amphidinium_carterae.1